MPALKRPLTSARAWQEVLDRIADKAEDRALEIAELIVQEVQLSSVTPVRKTNANRQPSPGHLKRSARAVQLPDGDVAVILARYWVFVEYGARGVEPQPFLWHAIETVEAAFD